MPKDGVSRNCLQKGDVMCRFLFLQNIKERPKIQISVVFQGLPGQSVDYSLFFSFFLGMLEAFVLSQRQDAS